MSKVKSKVIARARELQTLEEEYSKEFSFVILYGRRRVGKTTLLEEYTKNRKVLFFTVSRINDYENINTFKNLIAEFIGKEYLKEVDFSNLDNVFSLLDEVKEKFVLVIDEFPYLIKANRNIPYIMQNIIDKKLRKKKIQLILSGSSLSIMSDEVLAYKSPLYGRRTSKIKLPQFECTNVVKYFQKDYSIQDIVYIYSCTGGIPYYFKQFNTEIKVKENIQKLFLDKSGLLFEEGTFLLENEFNESRNYRTILKFIGNGEYKLGEIASSTGIEKNNLSWYLDSLIKAGFIRSIRSYFSKEGSRDTLYALADNYLKFYYRFVYPNRSQIDRDITVKIEKNLLHTHIGRIYEDIARDYLIKKYKTDFLPQWGKYRETIEGQRNSKIYEIALVSYKDNILYAFEVKWSDLTVQATHTLQSSLNKKLEILLKQQSIQPSSVVTGIVCRKFEGTTKQKNDLGVIELEEVV